MACSCRCSGSTGGFWASLWSLTVLRIYYSLIHVYGGRGLLVETGDSAAAHSEDLGLESTQSPRTFTGLRTGSQASSGCPLYSKGLRCRSGLDGGRTRNGQICVISNDSVRLGGNIQLSSLFRKGQVVQLRLTRVSILSQSRDLKRAHGKRNAGNIASK